MAATVYSYYRIILQKCILTGTWLVNNTLLDDVMLHCWKKLKQIQLCFLCFWQSPAMPVLVTYMHLSHSTEEWVFKSCLNFFHQREIANTSWLTLWCQCSISASYIKIINSIDKLQLLTKNFTELYIYVLQTTVLCFWPQWSFPELENDKLLYWVLHLLSSICNFYI